MSTAGPRDSCSNMTSHHQIFIVGCLQFVKSQNLHAALYLSGNGTSKMTRKLHSWMSMRDNALPLKNGLVKSSRMYLVNDNDV